jgi:hypothetical protein
MSTAFRNFIMASALLTVFAVPAAQAHLMHAQHGTLNVAANGIYMVISLPVSAFDGLDRNRDGAVSMVEFNRERSNIIRSLRRQVALSDAQGPYPLQDIVLSPVSEGGSPTHAIAQLTVMGRFAVREPSGPLRFYLGLYGDGHDEQRVTMTATREGSARHVFRLTPEDAVGELFPVLYPL